MRRISIGTIFLLAIAAVVFAQAAVFHTADATVNSAGSLVVSWDERGVGNGGSDGLVHYTLTVDASATYGCVNGGGNHPKAANKETFNGPLSADAAFAPSKNGRIIGSLTVGPLGADGFSCPGGQTLVLGSVSYTNVALTDTTFGSTADIAGSFSRTLVAF